MRVTLVKPPALLICLALIANSCSPARQEQDLLVTLVADGAERSILLPGPTTVSSLLERADIFLGSLDRIEPPLNTMLLDGMRVTLVRVIEQDLCERHEIPFQVVGSGDYVRGTDQRVQPGLPGEEERCHRVRLEDGIERERVETGRVIIREPVDEIWRADLSPEVKPLSFPGTLVWTSEGNAWLARKDSGQLRQLTREGKLDGKVLALSSDGNSLLFTRHQGDARSAPDSNRLWLIADLDHPADAIQLLPENVRHARWMPGSASEFGYTDSATETTFSIVRIDPDTGEILTFRELLAPNPEGGPQLAETWFNWSGDGNYLSWAQGNTIGMMDMSGEITALIPDRNGEEGRLAICAGHAPNWSPNSRFVVTGMGTGDAPTSVTIVDTHGDLLFPLTKNVGPCPAPVWAPDRNTGLLAYLQARDPEHPLSRAGHDLMIVDRDGSNGRLLFPEAGQPGLAPRQVVWSPDSRRLAFTWQEQLWTVDVDNGDAQPFPFTGSVSGLAWAG
ncbi:MAG: ubiquitin-like domain-containing protein [Anaerolineaceae bacterium]|nr:ubiquitin-like domain-containing protein [Anaerolineaceae bacterium]